ncbi:glycerophosphodiester phosphodiesterase family protein [Arthrobacter sp. HY1533]|uniref:glycerophosphodiester phosphodiesterase family protein n=1 Tax=Arthrobacter sp. HY1533 TaxID=2970919 RepID=UPI0022B9E5AD|nr:glycerophosphodiester phosphodiesterase family protein [Arthrobacter sp. HY1533]
MPAESSLPPVRARSLVFASVVASLGLLRRRLLLVVVATIATQGVYVWAVQPLLLALFQGALSAAGVDGLSQASLPGLLSSPLAILALVLLALVATFFALLEISVFTVIAQICRRGGTPTLPSILGGLAGIGRKVAGWQFLLFAGYALLILPLSHIGVGPALASHIAIPEFVSGEITKTLPGAVGYALAVAALVYLGLRLAATAAVLGSSQESVLGVMRQSMDLTRRTQLYIAAVLVLVGVVAAVVFFAVALIGTVPVALSASDATATSVAGSMLAVLKLVQFIGTGIAAAFLAFFFVALLHGGRQVPTFGGPVRDRTSRMAAATVLVLFVLLGTPPTVFASMAPQPSERPLVIAHRGYTAGGVENTLGSLRAAAAAGADMVEMDIQETSDQRFVVIHDAGLQRLAGDPRSVFELPQAELAGIQVSQDGFSDHIPTLEQYLQLADELGIRVLVEVKPHGHEAPGFTQRVVATLAKLDSSRKHMVQSLDAGIVAGIVSQDPSRQAILVTGFQIGNAPRTPAAGVAIEDWSYSDQMLVRLHDEGKKLFVWTINDPALIRDYMGRGVDGIITDNVAGAITTRQLSESITNPVSRYLESATWQIQPR